jgi:hypothetical protein
VSNRTDSPRARVEHECRRRGKTAFVAGCVDLVEGRAVDPELVAVLGGRSAAWTHSADVPGPDYWLRVWATRGLLWAWDPVAAPALQRALVDDAWRVREMALKVVARHLVEDALSEVARLQDDPSARVRAAAGRALVRLATAEPR